MGGVICREGIYDAFMQWGDETGNTIEMFHGYTYSGHPVAAAAGLATLEVYKEENLFDRCAELAPYWEDAVHSLKGAKHVIDIRNLGLVAGIFTKAFEQGLMIRVTADIIALSPPLIVSKEQIDQMIDLLREVLSQTD